MESGAIRQLSEYPKHRDPSKANRGLKSPRCRSHATHVATSQLRHDVSSHQIAAKVARSARCVVPGSSETRRERRRFLFFQMELRVVRSVRVENALRPLALFSAPIGFEAQAPKRNPQARVAIQGIFGGRWHPSWCLSGRLRESLNCFPLVRSTSNPPLI